MRSDEELWRLHLGGSRAATAELVERYYRRCFRYCYLLLNNKDDASDAVQEVWAKLAKAREHYRKFEIVLFAALRNEAFSTLRKRGRFEDLGDIEPPDNSHVALQPEADLDPDCIAESVLARLDPEDRELVILRIYEGRDWEAISELLGVRKNTLEVRWHRLMEKLRVSLTKDLVRKKG